MNKKTNIWEPVFTINAAIVRALMDIEAAKAIVENTTLSPVIEAELRYKARIRSTHYSTRIEGNKLTLKEAQEVIEQKKTSFHGRERDVHEVRNYWEALIKVEEWASNKTEFSEDLIKRVHAIVDKGKRARPAPYRDGQNVIRDSASGGIVYMPPEAKDVVALMGALVRWVRKAQKERIPAPIVAALLHYQFVTIHPYYDGNGRTARLLATFILQRDGYGLNGFFSMEEHHARDLEKYYASLSVHGHYNYYSGRANADLTSWVSYFVILLAGVFKEAEKEVLKLSKKSVSLEPDKLRQLDHRARVVLSLFVKKERLTSAEIASSLGLSSRMVRVLLTKWVEDGWLIVADKSNRGRAYILSAIYRQSTSRIKAIK
jgi:Fic family protein